MEIITIVLLLVIISIQIYRRLLANSTLILIEGLDCSGKKTLANNMLKHFKDENIVINIGSLFKSPLSLLSDRFTYNWRLPNSFRSMLYAINYILDGLFYIPKRNKVIIQISYLPRHKGYNTVKQLSLINILHFILSPFYVRFNKIIYLYADYDTRIKRHIEQYKGKKAIQNIEDRFFTNNKDIYKKWEKVVRNNLQELSGDIFVVDTSDLNSDEILNNLFLQDFKL